MVKRIVHLVTRKFILYFSMILLTISSIEVVGQAIYYLSAGDVLFRRVAVPIYEYDPTRCWRTKPNLNYRHRTNEFDVTILTDSRGFRTGADRKPISLDKAENVVRILFLGPSFTFGWGNNYADTYPVLLEIALRRTGLNVEALNLGTPAQGAGRQLCWLRKEGVNFKPDVVVQTVYQTLGNLETDCTDDKCPLVKDGYLIQSGDSIKTRIRSIVKNSAIVFYGFIAWGLIDSKRDHIEGTGTELRTSSSDGRARDRTELLARYQTYAEYVRGILGEKTPVVFIYIPLSYFVHLKDIARWRHLGVANVQKEKKAHELNLGFLKSNSVNIVDTMPALITNNKERMYYWLDVHLTARGNQAVARASEPQLRHAVREASTGNR